jgi:hypothetical protein
MYREQTKVIESYTMKKELTPEAKAKIMASEMADYITPKQQAFIHAYAANGNNGRQAAIAAGYAPASAHVTASTMLKMDKIRKRIEPTQDKQTERLGLDADWIVSRLMKEAEAGDNSEAARVRALELLGKVEGIFAPDKKQIETINGGDFLANLDMTDEDDPDTLQ